MKKMIPFLCSRRRNSHILWICAGGYFIYLAWTLFRDVKSADPGAWGMYLCVAAFVLIGLALLATGLLALFKGWYAEMAEADNNPPPASEYDDDESDDYDDYDDYEYDDLPEDDEPAPGDEPDGD